MKLDTETFKGEAPRVTPRNLPAGLAQNATNSRLQTGDLEGWRQFVSEKVLTAFGGGGAVKTIYKLKDKWLSFKEQVDVARGLIPGDVNYFAFLTSPVLYTEPRYTTYALATTGAEPYPVTTLPLGMPAPVAAPTLVIGTSSDPTTFSVDITDDCSDLTVNWELSSGQLDTGDNSSIVRESAVRGNPAPSFEMVSENNGGNAAYMTRDFGIAGASLATLQSDLMVYDVGPNSGAITATLFGVDDAGSGCRIIMRGDIGSNLLIGIANGVDFQSGWGGIIAETVCTGALALGTWYTIKASRTLKADGSTTIKADLYIGATLKGTVTTTNEFTNGGRCGGISMKGDDRLTEYFDNFHITGSGKTGTVIVTTATSYVYTFVGANSWESAPSPASATLLRPDGASVTITTATSHSYSSGYSIASKRIYRAVSGATGDAFFLLAEIPLATATYVDILDDSKITSPGTVLATTDFDLPDPAMQGIRPLPNGAMTGFVRNQLCFSEPGYPYAWPIKYRLPTDTNIVAISNLDNTIVIGTESFPYTASGNEPANYAMSQPGEKQACVSKLSMTYVDGYGVVYASPDGFQLCAGSAGNMKNATELIFTKEQWEALDPQSITSVVYDGVLFFWFDGTNPDSGYALDTKQSGFGLIRLSNHITAAYVDPLTDSLYMVMDVNSEPVEAALPVASTAPTITALTIFRYDAHATNRIRYQWRGKLNLMDYETTFHFAKVEAGDFTNLVLRVYADGVLIYTRQVTSAKAFRIPGTSCYSTYEVELVGTSRARSVQLAETVAELN